MLFYLSTFEFFWGPLRLFKYLSVRAAGALLTAIVLGFWIAPALWKRLRDLKMAQTFRDKATVGALADLHAHKKNTPTMGGLLIYICVGLSTVLWVEFNRYVFGALLVYTVLTLLGFFDDWLKVTKKNSKGVSGRVKLSVQFALAASFLGLLWVDPQTRLAIQDIWVPFMKEPLWALASFPIILVLSFLVLSGSSNAINLTDGVDGLAIGCTIMAAMAYAIMAYCAGNALIADYLHIGHVAGGGELAVVCAGLVGASLVFLWYNAHPAEVFMGDTGSLAIGGLLGAIALMVLQPFTLVIVGGVFVAEALSVILQVGSFKLRGKRIFRMSPLHHHFELKGWHENKVVLRFWIVSFVCALLGLATLKLR
jgi:phospho-N-acetylmuramoyl-pentapeptide-transferase